MLKYLSKRLIRGFITFFISVTLVFWILRLMPGDPATLLIDPTMTLEELNRIKADFGLDEPEIVQYFKYITQLFTQGNVGNSFTYKMPVTDLLMTRLPWTLLLMCLTQLCTMLIGIPLGILSAYKRGSLTDQVINSLCTFGISVFVPWLGITLLYFFGFKIPLFPIGGAYTPGVSDADKFMDILHHLALPVITLTIVNLANYVMYMRASMVDVLSEDYIRTARSKGMTETRVVLKHGMRNALIPTITMSGMMLATMVGGAVLTETVYSFPGVGRMIYDAVSQQDYPVLQGAFIVLALTVIIMNILIDLVYMFLDPRIKLG